VAEKTSINSFWTSIIVRATCAMALCMLVMVAGCANAPVQDMSDARQAVEAAVHSGAATAAPDKMTAAQTALKLAERLLRDHQFTAARHYARDARAKAMEAQAIAQSQAGESRPQP
jgi:hypothetical protein